MPNLSFEFLPGERRFREHCEQADTVTVLQYLNHSNYVFRRNAAEILLMRGGKDIIETGLHMCFSKNFKLRQMGALIIGEIKIDDIDKYNESVYILKDLALNDSSSRVRAEAIRALSLRYQDNTQLLSILLLILKHNINSPSVSVRWSITGTLPHIKDKSVILFLEKLLRDTDLDIRNWTAFAVNLTGLDSKKIRFGLVRMLKEPYYDARCEAITALAVRQDKRVVPALKKELAEEEVRDSMIEAAGSLGDPEFIPILENLLIRFEDSDGLIQKALAKLNAAMPAG